MASLYPRVACGLLLAAMALSGPICAQDDGRSRDVQTDAGAAVVVVRATTDDAEIADLLDGFRSAHPGLSVSYAKVNSSRLYDTFLEEASSGAGTADIVWSSAMDLQIKLVNDGYAARYVSPEAASFPSWAIWRNEAFGITAEPIVIAYNRKLLPPSRVPATRADLVRLLNERPDERKGKVAAYDPERRGVGSLILSHDVEVTTRT